MVLYRVEKLADRCGDFIGSFEFHVVPAVDMYLSAVGGQKREVCLALFSLLL